VTGSYHIPWFWSAITQQGQCAYTNWHFWRGHRLLGQANLPAPIKAEAALSAWATNVNLNTGEGYNAPNKLCL
jgi:aminoglycoside phosphotransferase (APT) family kinase protein